MTTQQWIGPFDQNFAIGDRGFLVRHEHNLKGWVRHDVRDEPARTNVSFVERLHGWCGTTNDVATYADGVVEVIKIARNGRLLVRPVAPDALQVYLGEVGYPDLAA